jgi:glutathione S-transferase
MPINPTADIEVTAFEWVPPFAQGFVRDLRVRWALEEIGADYRVRLIGGPEGRPRSYWLDQPFNQVPVYKENGLTLFESGAILIHIGEKDEHLLPRDNAGRMRAIAWLIAALNSIEPQTGQLAAIDVFNPGSDWGKQRRPAVIELVAGRLARVATWLGDKDWLEDRFTVGDMMMIDALRGLGTELLAPHANLTAYVERGKARPAFQQALSDQLAAFREHEPEGVAA